MTEFDCRFGRELCCVDDVGSMTEFICRFGREVCCVDDVWGYG